MSTTSRHLLIFARHPRLGRGKRRLAAQVGDGLTLRWYRAHLEALLRRLAAPDRWRLVLALEAPPARYSAAACLPVPYLPVLRQDQGAGPKADLGARMLTCMRPLAPGPTVLIGSDVLGIERCDIARLFAALERPGSLLAPARDGGFWALGHRGPALAGTSLAKVPWSRPDTFEQARAALKARIIPLVKSDLDSLGPPCEAPQNRRPQNRRPQNTRAHYTKAHMSLARAQPLAPLMPNLEASLKT